MIDVITISHSLDILSSQKSITEFNLGSLANFLETIVLFDKIHVEKKAYDHVASNFSSRSLDSLLGKDIISSIEPICFAKYQHASCNDFAENLVHSPTFNQMLNDWTKLYPEIKLRDVLHNAGDVSDILSQYDEIPAAFNYPSGASLGTIAAFGSAVRAWYYLGLAAEKNLMYVPNDFRALFVEYLLKKNSSKIAIEKTENLFEKNMKKSYEWFGDHYIKHVRFPLIANYIFSKSKELGDVISIALKLRNSDDARNFRNTCKQLDVDRKKENFVDARNTINKIEKELKNIEKSLDIPTTSVSLSFPPAVSFTVGTDILKDYVSGRQFVFLRKMFTGSNFSDRRRAFFKISKK